MRISDWSSDVCSSDLIAADQCTGIEIRQVPADIGFRLFQRFDHRAVAVDDGILLIGNHDVGPGVVEPAAGTCRSEEHTSELQSLMRISYAVFCLKKKNTITPQKSTQYDKHDT